MNYWITNFKKDAKWEDIKYLNQKILVEIKSISNQILDN